MLVRVGPNRPLGARSDSVNEALNGRSVFWIQPFAVLGNGPHFLCQGAAAWPSALAGVVVATQDDLEIDRIVRIGLWLAAGQILDGCGRHA